MSESVRMRCLLFILLMTQTISLTAWADTNENLLSNGGFEDGLQGWMWEQWNQKPQPGFLDRKNAYEGLSSFSITLPDAKETSRTLAISTNTLDPTKNYELKIALSCQDVPQDAVAIRVLQIGTEKNGPNGKARAQGWINLPPNSGKSNLITTGGTHDWQMFSVYIPAEAIKPSTTRLTIFIVDHAIRTGVVGIDNLTFHEAAADSSSNHTAKPTPPPSVQTSLNTHTLSYKTADPTVLHPQSDSPVAIVAKPDQALYRIGQPPVVQIQTAALPGAKVSYRILDGFGNEQFTSKPVACDSAKFLTVQLPGDCGYYEIIAEVRENEQLLGEARRSIGLLSPPPALDADEPFGLWVGGYEHHLELGAKWRRLAIFYQKYEKDPAGYIQELIQNVLQPEHQNDRRVLAYMKNMSKSISKTRKVIVDEPANWKELETFWKTVVQGLGNQVDVWGLINEPYAGMWQGDNQLIMRYWSLMRRLVDQYAPKTPLIGPSLNVNKPHLMEQYRELLDMGLADLIDGVELHTYTGGVMPADARWSEKIETVRKLTREVAGRELPIYSTEMGMPAEYDQELLQAQYTARSMLWAKRLGLKMLIWHDFSWPQGPQARMRNFAIFRDGKQRQSIAQPRPAGVAFGVLTRQLTGTHFARELDYLGPSIKAFVFEHNGEARLAIWSLDHQEHQISMMADQPQVVVTDLFGCTQPIPTQNGMLTLNVTASPQYISGLPKHLLDGQSLAAVSKPLRLLPGQRGQTTLNLSNPTGQPVQIRLEMLDLDGWNFQFDEQTTWSLQPGETRQITINATSPQNASVGNVTTFAKLFLDDRYVNPVAIPIEVQPQVEAVDIHPGFQNGKPALVGTLVSHDPQLTEAHVSLDGAEEQAVTVPVQHAERTNFVLPTPWLSPLKLQTVTLKVAGSDGRKVEQSQTVSFVPAQKAKKRSIDGKLNDWPKVASDAPIDVQWAWSANMLYLAVRVKDSRHVQSQPIEQMWREDSIQVGVAPTDPQQLLREPISEMHESPYTVLCLALKDGQALMHRSKTPNFETAPLGKIDATQVQRAITHRQSETVYEVAFPASAFGLDELSAGEVLRVSILVNENDGDGRTLGEWFGGIALTKTSELFGHLVLLPDNDS